MLSGFLYVVIGLYGILIGSFLNVCIYRIPKGESIVTSRSHCMGCGYHLQWYDLIPVFSYLFLRGRCGQCKSKISIQYPLVELANGLLYVVIFIRRGLPLLDGGAWQYHMITVLYCLVSSALLVLSIIDFKTYEIPVGINYFIFCIAFIRVALEYQQWAHYVIGFFIVSGLLYLIYLISRGAAIGGGDIKLMAAAGLLLGWKEILLAFFIGCILGSILHIIRMKVSKAEKVLALGPYLSMGIWITMLFGEPIWQWYIGLLQL